MSFFLDPRWFTLSSADLTGDVHFLFMGDAGRAIEVHPESSFKIILGSTSPFLMWSRLEQARCEMALLLDTLSFLIHTTCAGSSSDFEQFLNQKSSRVLERASLVFSEAVPRWKSMLDIHASLRQADIEVLMKCPSPSADYYREDRSRMASARVDLLHLLFVSAYAFSHRSLVISEEAFEKTVRTAHERASTLQVRWMRSVKMQLDEQRI
jgi:hypothetical protein